MPNKKLRNNKGVTLVELMIALVVLLIVFMGLLQATMVSIQSNMKNVLRDEAVGITSDRLARLRNIAFTDALLNDTSGVYVDDDLDSATAGVQSTITRVVRNASVDFKVKKIVTNLDSSPTNHKRITVSTSWSWQGELFDEDHNKSVVMVATRTR